jgi:hypothetical protein
VKQRLLAGKRTQAERGELGMPAPRGNGRRPSGELLNDPDAPVQATMHLIFEQVARCGTVNGVLRYRVGSQSQLPPRVRCGPNPGELAWHRPNRTTLSNLLHPPSDAGAYGYGRRPPDPRRQQPGRPGTGRRVAPPGAWPGWLKDRVPASLRWAQFERNRQPLAATQGPHPGAIRHGPSVLAGWVLCGRGGLRLAATDHNNGRRWRDAGRGMAGDYGAPRWQWLVGQSLDDGVSPLALPALAPAALAIRLPAAADLAAARQPRHQPWQPRLERAPSQVERAARQYQAVAPDHRLVARTLERQGEDA